MDQFGKGSARRSKMYYFMILLGVAIVFFFMGMGVGMGILRNILSPGSGYRGKDAVEVYLRENIAPEDSIALLHFISSRPYVESYESITKEMARKRFIADGGPDVDSLLIGNPLPAPGRRVF